MFRSALNSWLTDALTFAILFVMEDFGYFGDDALFDPYAAQQWDYADDPDLEEPEPDEYDDGDYPGVEQDENMSRIEGDDFWMESTDIDSWGGEDF